MENPPAPIKGWRLPRGANSLPEVHGSIAVPHDAGFWRKLFAFAGPAISLKQDIKERTFDSQGNRTEMRVLGSETSLRFKLGGRAE